MANEHLATYLNDHLAGSVLALELMEHLEEAHAGTELADFMAALRAEVTADQQELEALMERLEVGESRPRKATAWLAEKVALLKLRLDDSGDGALRLFESLEALSLGIEGKRALWRALAAAAEASPALRGLDFLRLIQSAEQQRNRLEARRLEAAKAALGTAA
jgi:hypothetical protein